MTETLETTEMAFQHPMTREYHLGPLIYQLVGDSAYGHQRLYTIAHKHVRYLREISQETVGLQVWMGKKRLVVDEAVSPQNIKFSMGVGSAGPVYVGASGKLILAALSERDLHLLLDKIELVSHGPNSITDKTVLLRELKKIREQGYAISYNELGKGAAVIAVPIKHYFVPAALGIVGPADRFYEKMMDFLKPLLACSKQIAKDLKK